MTCRTALFLTALIPATLGACTPENPREVEAQANMLREANSDPEDCLLLVWSNQRERDVEFDRRHDFVDGGAISCATGTSASRFEAVIATLREAARSGNKARILDQVGLPLLYIDATGTRRELESRAEVEAVFDEIFDAYMIARLQRLDLSRMSVASEQGGYFDLGALWLVVDRQGGKPRLMTVNRQALDEALDAARDGAERNRGERVPFD